MVVAKVIRFAAKYGFSSPFKSLSQLKRTKLIFLFVMKCESFSKDGPYKISHSVRRDFIILARAKVYHNVRGIL